jgi:hypothetical protein
MRIQRLACGAVGDVTRPGQGSTHRRLVELRWSRSTRASPCISAGQGSTRCTARRTDRSRPYVLPMPRDRESPLLTGHVFSVRAHMGTHVLSVISSPASGFGASHGGAPHGFLSCGGDPVTLFACARTVWIECSRVRSSPPKRKLQILLCPCFPFSGDENAETTICKLGTAAFHLLHAALLNL